MMKIMIVDDTPVFREHLRTSIDWETYGFTVICEARDGREALDLYEVHQPDIVLADIAMPHMNGLELAGELYKKHDSPFVVIITGFNEFEYARQALRLGVSDYIVKPFEKQALIMTLLKLRDNINRALEARGEREELLRMRRVQTLRQFIYLQSPNIAAALPDASALFPHPWFLVVTARVSLSGTLMGLDEIMEWQEIMASLLRTAIQIDGKAETFHDLEGNTVTILNFNSREAMQAYDSSEFRETIRLARENVGFMMAVGISGYCYSAGDLAEAYRQSVRVLGVPHVGQDLAIFDYKKLEHSKASFYSQQFVDGIVQGLELLDYPRIESLMIEELDAIKEFENPEYSTMIYMSLLSILFSFLVRQGRSISAVFGEDLRAHPPSVLEKLCTYAEKRSFVCGCYRQAIKFQLAHRNTRAAQIAQRTKRYIEGNYQNNKLLVADIAKKLLMNQTYLRSMFKMEFQTTISDYITKVRMEKAMELIKKGGHKLSAVAQLVGYNDTGYFSKCFKKYFGLSPSDIRVL